MRGTAASLPVKYNLKQIHHLAGSWGTVGALTPRKAENNESKKGGPLSNENTDPTVAFSRPSPLPPVLGPLIALSLFETWSSRDGDDK